MYLLFLGIGALRHLLGKPIEAFLYETRPFLKAKQVEVQLRHITTCIAASA